MQALEAKQEEVNRLQQTIDHMSELQSSERASPLKSQIAQLKTENSELAEALKNAQEASTRGNEHKGTMVQVMENLTQQNQAQRKDYEALQEEHEKVKEQVDDLRAAIAALTAVQGAVSKGPDMAPQEEATAVDEAARKRLKELESLLRLRDAALAQAEEQLQAKQPEDGKEEAIAIKSELRRREEEIAELTAALDAATLTKSQGKKEVQVEKSMVENMLQSTRKCSAFIELNRNCLVELEELMQCNSEPDLMVGKEAPLSLEAQ